MPGFHGVLPGWDIRDGKGAALIGYCKKGMTKYMDVGSHPPMGVTVYLEERRLFDLLRDFHPLTAERQGKVKDRALLSVGMNDMQLWVVISYDQPLTPSHRHDTGNKTARPIVEQILLVLARRSWGVQRVVNVDHNVLEPSARTDDIDFVGQC